MRAILILFLAVPAFGDCTIAEALVYQWPGCHWTVRGDTYQGIEWLDKTPAKPTATQVKSAIAACTADQTAKTTAKVQCKTILTDQTKTPTERLNALIDYLEIK